MREFKIDKKLRGKNIKSINNIQLRTKAGQNIKNSKFIKEGKYKQTKKTVPINTILKYEGTKKYIVSGSVRIATNTQIRDKIYYTNNMKDKKFNFVIEGKDNMSTKEMREYLTAKLQNYYKYGRDGTSNNEVVGLSFKLVSADGVNISRMKLFNINFLRIKSLDADSIEVKNNCVYDYLCNELPKFYKRFNKDKLKEQIDDIINGDIFTDGISINELEFLLIRYYKNVNFWILGIDDRILRSKTNSKHNMKLIFKVFNNHLYPITSKENKDKIIKSILDKKIIKEENLNFEGWVYMDKEQDFKFKDGYNYIINKNIDFDEFKIYIMKKTGFIIEYWREGVFKHPTINCLIYDYNDYHRREETFNKLNLNNIKRFCNESYPVIANILLNSFNSLSSSYYNKQSYYYLHTYEPKPIVDEKFFTSNDDIKGVDIAKHYTSIFYNNFQEKGVYIPIYDYHNYVKDYDGSKIEIGEYYIEPIEYKKVRFGGYFIHSYVIKKLLKMNIITKDNIKYCITTKNVYKPKNFKKFVEAAKDLDEPIFKKLNNMLNGNLNNNKRKKNVEHYLTNDICTLDYLINSSDKWDADVDDNYNIWFKKWSNEINYNNTSSYYRTTLSFSILEVMKLINKIDGKIIKVKTDAVYYIGNEFKYDKYDSIMDSLGKYRKEETISKEFYNNRYEAKEFQEYKHELNNIIILGGGGYGKSYNVIQDCKEDDKILFLTPTNAAKKNLIDKSRLLKPNNNYEFKTLSSFMDNNSFNHNLININKYDKVIVDEIFMVSSAYMRVLVHCNNIIFLGDEKQLPSIENSEINLLESYVGKFFYKKIQKYTEGKARYDKETFELINNFVKSNYKFSKLESLNTIDDNKTYDFYICHTNKTRKKCLKKVCDYKHPKGEEINFKYQNQYEKYKIDVNMPVICTVNFSKDLFNNWVGYIKNISDDEIIITDDVDEFKLTKYQFKYYFLPFYASTIHKVQGNNIKGDYAILECYDNYTSSNLIYTALTRCNNKNQIHIYKNNSSVKVKSYHPHIYEEDYKLKNLKKEKHKIYRVVYEINDKKYEKYYLDKIEYTKNSKKISEEIVYKAKMDIIQANTVLKNFKNLSNVITIQTIKNNTYIKTDENKSVNCIISKSCIKVLYYVDQKLKKKEIRYDIDALNEKIEDINESFKITKLNNKSGLNLELNDNTIKLI